SSHVRPCSLFLLQVLSRRRSVDLLLFRVCPQGSLAALFRSGSEIGELGAHGRCSAWVRLRPRHDVQQLHVSIEFRPPRGLGLLVSSKRGHHRCGTTPCISQTCTLLQLSYLRLYA